MLMPKLKLYSEGDNTTLKYFVWDSDTYEYSINNTFTHYETKDECQEVIDFFNSLSIIKAS